MRNSFTTPAVIDNQPASSLLKNGRSMGNSRLIQRIEQSSQVNLASDKTVSFYVPDEIEAWKGDKILEVNSLYQVNKVKKIDEHFRSINAILDVNGVLNLKFESSEDRKKRFFDTYMYPVSLFLYTFDFLIHRVLPKLTLSRNIYLKLTKKQNNVYSTAEVLGCLVYCGFEIIAYKTYDKEVLVRAKKNKLPVAGVKPSYGPIFKMKRVGKNGKFIYVYKIRTMHPYSEYLQEFVFKNNQLAEGGKFNQDFRITTWGKFLRKTWIDELPMIINWLKGDMKLIGARPLSEHYLSLYPEEVKFARFGVKPGLIPPFYADMPKTINEVFESEMKYINKYKQKKIATDVEYFCKSFKNIVLKGARSQ
ncbi:MAG TPA: sugar transferase [Rhodothermales bacterium]|nr:sugar transferase [Rhodothermales bacterium]